MIVAAGLPTIIKPFFGDQHFYADRIATLGIGSAVRNMTIENLSAAITTAVTDEKQIARAKLAGDAIRKVRRRSLSPIPTDAVNTHLSLIQHRRMESPLRLNASTVISTTRGVSSLPFPPLCLSRTLPPLDA